MEGFSGLTIFSYSVATLGAEVFGSEIQNLRRTEEIADMATAPNSETYSEPGGLLSVVPARPALEAKLKAEGEYAVFRQRQDAEFVSDFDREIKRIEGKRP